MVDGMCIYARVQKCAGKSVRVNYCRNKIHNQPWVQERGIWARHTHIDVCVCVFDDLRCWNKKDTSVCGKESKEKKKERQTRLLSMVVLSNGRRGKKKKCKLRWVGGKKVPRQGMTGGERFGKAERQKNLWSVMFTIWSGCYSEASRWQEATPACIIMD